MGTFPNYLNRYSLPSRFVILEPFCLLRLNLSSIAGRLGKSLIKIAGLRSDYTGEGGGGGAKCAFFVELSQLQVFMPTHKNACVSTRLLFTKRKKSKRIKGGGGGGP